MKNITGSWDDVICYDLISQTETLSIKSNVRPGDTYNNRHILLTHKNIVITKILKKYGFILLIISMV